jgi:hypothetical protein
MPSRWNMRVVELTWAATRAAPCSPETLTASFRPSAPFRTIRRMGSSIAVVVRQAHHERRTTNRHERKLSITTHGKRPFTNYGRARHRARTTYPLPTPPSHSSPNSSAYPHPSHAPLRCDTPIAARSRHAESVRVRRSVRACGSRERPRCW